MSDEKHYLVQVFWEGPFSVEQAIERPEAAGQGVYQLYGQHIVFGLNSLLYIGMTDGQTFARRLRQHRDRWLQYETDVSVRLGLLRDHGSLKLLRNIEALTIWWHSPPYNSKCIWRYGGTPLRVQNWGARGSLQPEYSSHWKPERVPPEGEEP